MKRKWGTEFTRRADVKVKRLVALYELTHDRDTEVFPSQIARTSSRNRCRVKAGDSVGQARYNAVPIGLSNALTVVSPANMDKSLQTLQVMGLPRSDYVGTMYEKAPVSFQVEQEAWAGNNIQLGYIILVRAINAAIFKICPLYDSGGQDEFIIKVKKMEPAQLDVLAPTTVPSTLQWHETKREVYLNYVGKAMKYQSEFLDTEEGKASLARTLKTFATLIVNYNTLEVVLRLLHSKYDEDSYAQARGLTYGDEVDLSRAIDKELAVFCLNQKLASRPLDMLVNHMKKTLRARGCEGVENMVLLLASGILTYAASRGDEEYPKTGIVSRRNETDETIRVGGILPGNVITIEPFPRSDNEPAYDPMRTYLAYGESVRFDGLPLTDDAKLHRTDHLDVDMWHESNDCHMQVAYSNMLEWAMLFDTRTKVPTREGRYYFSLNRKGHNPIIAPSVLEWYRHLEENCRRSTYRNARKGNGKIIDFICQAWMKDVDTFTNLSNAVDLPQGVNFLPRTKEAVMEALDGFGPDNFYHYFKLALDNNVPIYIGFLAVRKDIMEEHLVAIGVIPGPDTMRTFFASPQLHDGTVSTRGIRTLDLRLHLGVCIVRPENVVVQRSVQCAQVLHGLGLKVYGNGDTKTYSTQQRPTADMFVFAIDVYEEIPSPFDVTGRYNPAMYKPTGQNRGDLHYNMAEKYSALWGFKHGDYANAALYPNKVEETRNTLCFKGSAVRRRLDGTTVHLYRDIGDGHWRNCRTPGSREVRKGQAPTVRYETDMKAIEYQV